VAYPATGAQATVLTCAKIKEHTDGKTIHKIVFAPFKLLNIVAN